MDTTPDGTITLAAKRKYTLAELIAQCDKKAPVPADMALCVDFHPILTPVFHSNLTPLFAV